MEEQYLVLKHFKYDTCINSSTMTKTGLWLNYFFKNYCVGQCDDHSMDIKVLWYTRKSPGDEAEKLGGRECGGGGTMGTPLLKNSSRGTYHCARLVVPSPESVSGDSYLMLPIRAQWSDISKLFDQSVFDFKVFCFFCVFFIAKTKQTFLYVCRC